MEVNGISYEVSLVGISSDDESKASIVVNGESETFKEGNTKEVLDGLDVFVRTIFRTGDNSGYVIVEMGSDKLTLESGKKVKVGADSDNVDGTYVTLTGGVGACTGILIGIAADDNDNDHMLLGESFTDPVFGTVKVDLSNLPNAPDISDDKGTDASVRRTIEFSRASDDSVTINFEEKNGGIINQEFANTMSGTELEDDDAKDIEVLEGATLSEDLYYILNNGDNQHFVQLDDISFDSTEGISLVLQDVSGVKDDYELEEESDLLSTGDEVQKNIWGQTYTIRLVSNSTPSVQIYTSGYLPADADGTAKYLFPYIETISGKDHRVAFTEDVVEVLNDWVADDVIGNDATIELPSGSVVITEEGTNGTITVTESGASSGTNIATAADAGVDIGTVTYVFAVTAGTGTNAIDLEIGIGVAQNGSTDVMETDAGVLFMEEEDNSDSDNKHAVVIPTISSSTYADVDISTIVFTNSEADTGETFDDSDFSGSIDPFGVYVVEDSSDSDQDFAILTYPENQMHAEVFISEVGAVITPGPGPNIGGLIQVFNDKEMSKFQAKNLLVVGGSCVNSVAAKILESDVPLCGAAWTEKTGVGAGQYIIKTVASPYDEDKIAMLVAGFEATDTLNAVAKAKEGAATDVGSEEIYPKLSA